MRPGTLAVPERTLNARGKWLDELVAIVREYEALEVLVGLPVSLDGREHAAADRVRQVAADIAAAVPEVPLRLIDEGSPRPPPRCSCVRPDCPSARVGR